MIRWSLVFFTGLVLMLSACGKIGSGEKIAVVNWDKALQEHPRYTQLQKQKEEYNLLLDKRREQEIIGKTQMSGLAKLYQLKRNSRQNYLSADFLTRMAERQSAEQKKLKQLSNQLAEQVDKELAEEENKLNEHYRLLMFNLRIKLDTLRMRPEARKQLLEELKMIKEARDHDRMLLAQHKMKLVNQRMAPHVHEVQKRMDAYALQLRRQMLEDLKQKLDKDNSLMQKAPAALHELLGTVDRELDNRSQGIESLETSMKKDVESIITRLAKERRYSVVFYKYRTNVSADDITGDVISGLKKLTARAQASEALKRKVSEGSAGK